MLALFWFGFLVMFATIGVSRGAFFEGQRLALVMVIFMAVFAKAWRTA